MKNSTKTVIAILFTWNILLSFLLYLNIKVSSDTENKVRNIYNKSTSMTYEELNQEGVTWEFQGKGKK